MTPEELLEKAAEDIAKHGHAKRTYSEGPDEMTGPACAYGAMTRAATGGSTDYSNLPSLSMEAKELVDQAALLLSQTIRSYNRRYAPPLVGLGDSFRTVTHYNDAPGIAAEDVILTMKRAAHGE